MLASSMSLVDYLSTVVTPARSNGGFETMLGLPLALIVIACGQEKVPVTDAKIIWQFDTGG